MFRDLNLTRLIFPEVALFKCCALKLNVCQECIKGLSLLKISLNTVSSNVSFLRQPEWSFMGYSGTLKGSMARKHPDTVLAVPGKHDILWKRNMTSLNVAKL